jgi:hypothetical protein
MCSHPDFISTMAFGLVVLAAIPSGVLQHRFVRSLEKTLPAIWAELGTRKKLWTEDGNKHYAAAQRFLIWGEYKSLSDERLVKMGDRSRTAFFVFIASLVVFGFCAALTQGTPQLSCLWR